MKRQDENEMKKLYLEWKNSGMAKAAFAGANGIHHAKFYYWCTRFGKRENPSGGVGEFSLLEIPVSGPTPSGEAVARISYPSGASLELFGTLNADLVRELVR